GRPACHNLPATRTAPGGLNDVPHDSAIVGFNHRGWLSQVVLALLVAAGTLLPMSATPVSAHVRLVETVPTPESFLNSAPTEVRLTFGGFLQAAGNSVTVSTSGGDANRAGAVQLDAFSRIITTPLQGPLPNGLYRVTWVAVAADGHAERGSFTFTLRAGAEPPTMQLDRDVVDVGEPLVVTGSGFKASDAVAITAGADRHAVETVYADAEGRISQTVRLPNTVPFGSQRIMAADSDGAAATATVQVIWGGWPPVRIQIEPRSLPQDLLLDVTVLNRSGYDMGVDTVRIPVPPGTSFVAASTGGRLTPEGAVVWETLRLRPEETLGPFTVHLDARALPAGTPVQASAEVLLRHPFEPSPASEEMPSFQTPVRSEPITARTGGRD
ncbi:MAG TPA: copper resistance CopC family protein, partial [Gemmatimonadales bacterium]|nr:copper resistance CopC family protein [Gemmatimonadales bacterium]